MRFENRRRRKKKQTKLILLTIFLVFLVSFLLYGFKLYNSFSNIYDENSWKGSDKREDDIDLKNVDPISILLMGVDERKNDKGRADTLVVITLNAQEKSMKMVSIPRDTLVEIADYGKKDKINHSYAFGGTSMTLKTVENFLDIPIDYYVKFNMKGFVEIVDALGGIEIENDFAFTWGHYHIPEGKVKLNGSEALIYATMRKLDPKGDLGRNERQRKVINAIIDKGANIGSITKLDNILKAVGDNVKTNMTINEMRYIQKGYMNTKNNIETIEISGENTTINNIYYYSVPEEERERVSNILKNHLQIN
jgi:polyisoprenyl-teichoic acid--peptidoglycan teichoic acid transferase